MPCAIATLAYATTTSSAVVGSPQVAAVSRLAVLAGVATEPLIEDRFAAVELFTVVAVGVKRRWPTKFSQAS